MLASAFGDKISIRETDDQSGYDLTIADDNRGLEMVREVRDAGRALPYAIWLHDGEEWSFYWIGISKDLYIQGI